MVAAIAATKTMVALIPTTQVRIEFFSFPEAVSTGIVGELARFSVAVDSGAAVLSSGSVTTDSVTGGSVTGGSVTGGSVTGGSVTGGSVTGGCVGVCWILSM